MSDSAIGFPNQVAHCPWLKLDKSSTRLPGPPSLETTPSLLWQAWSTRRSIIQIRLQKGHDVLEIGGKVTFRSFFLLRKALIDFRKQTHRSWYHQLTRMHTGTLGKNNLRDNVPVCMFSHSSTKWSKKKGNFQRKIFFSGHFKATPCNKPVVALVAR